MLAVGVGQPGVGRDVGVDLGRLLERGVLAVGIGQPGVGRDVARHLAIASDRRGYPRLGHRAGRDVGPIMDLRVELHLGGRVEPELRFRNAAHTVEVIRGGGIDSGHQRAVAGKGARRHRAGGVQRLGAEIYARLVDRHHLDEGDGAAGEELQLAPFRAVARVREDGCNPTHTVGIPGTVFGPEQQARADAGTPILGILQQVSEGEDIGHAGLCRVTLLEVEGILGEVQREDLAVLDVDGGNFAILDICRENALVADLGTADRTHRNVRCVDAARRLASEIGDRDTVE